MFGEIVVTCVTVRPRARLSLQRPLRGSQESGQAAADSLVGRVLVQMLGKNPAVEGRIAPRSAAKAHCFSTRFLVGHGTNVGALHCTIAQARAVASREKEQEKTPN